MTILVSRPTKSENKVASRAIFSVFIFIYLYLSGFIWIYLYLSVFYLYFICIYLYLSGFIFIFLYFICIFINPSVFYLDLYSFYLDFISIYIHLYSLLVLHLFYQHRDTPHHTILSNLLQSSISNLTCSNKCMAIQT